MFVKNTLKEEVSIVVELGGAVRRNFDSAVDVKNMNLQDCHVFLLFYKKKKTLVWQCLQGKQIFLREFQVIIIAEPPQNSPGGLMSTSLDKEGVQEQEACSDEGQWWKNAKVQS